MNEIKQRLKSSRNWLALIEELEADAEKVKDREEKSKRLYALGQACEELFLRKDKAMVSYQKAFKLHPQNVRPLERARLIYHEMGNLKMVAKLMDFQLKVERDAQQRAQLLTSLAFTCIDLRMLDAAREKINEAHGSDPNAEGLDEAIATVSYDPNAWEAVISALMQQAEFNGASDGGSPYRESQSPTPNGVDRARLLVRAARIYAIQAPTDPMREQLLAAAVEADPQSASANFLYETLLQEQGRTEEITALHEKRVRDAREEDRAKLYQELASLWAIRFVDVTTTATFYERALREFYIKGADPFPGHLAAFNFLKDVKGPQGQWAALLDLFDLALEAPLLEDDMIVLATMAGEIAYQEVKDVERASAFFGLVQRFEPDNSRLLEFLGTHPEAQVFVDRAAEAPMAEAQALADVEPRRRLPMQK